MSDFVMSTRWRKKMNGAIVQGLVWTGSIEELEAEGESARAEQAAAATEFERARAIAVRDGLHFDHHESRESLRLQYAAAAVARCETGLLAMREAAERVASRDRYIESVLGPDAAA